MPPPDELDETYASSVDPGSFAPLCEYMMSSAKPETHNILHCRQMTIEPRSLVTCTENLVKFGPVVFEICERTDRQTDRHADRSTSQSHTYQSEVTRVSAAADRPARCRGSEHVKYSVSHHNGNQTISSTRPSCWKQILTVGVINSCPTTIRRLWHSPTN